MGVFWCTYNIDCLGDNADMEIAVPKRIFQFTNIECQNIDGALVYWIIYIRSRQQKPVLVINH